MQNVFGVHRQDDIGLHRDVKLREILDDALLVVPVGIFKLATDDPLTVAVGERPVPLLTDDADVVSAIGHRPHVHEVGETPIEHRNNKNRWNDRPSRFEEAAVRRGVLIDHLPRMPAAIANAEIGHRGHDQHKEEDADVVNEVIRRIDPLGERGKLLRGHLLPKPIQPMIGVRITGQHRGKHGRSKLIETQ